MQLTVIPKPARCAHCGEPLLLTDPVIEIDNGLGELRHAEPCEEWRPRGPVSDGTLPCPESRHGVPCLKTIPEGWHENEGHPGGHWFQPEADAERMRTEHYDTTAAVSGLPFEPHRPGDCPGRPACNWWALP
jgi:hypothetical protein